MNMDLDLAGWLGYSSRWSALNKNKKRTGIDPLEEFLPLFIEAWEDPKAMRTVRWPLAIRMGSVDFQI